MARYFLRIKGRVRRGTRSPAIVYETIDERPQHCMLHFADGHVSIDGSGSWSAGHFAADSWDMKTGRIREVTWEEAMAGLKEVRELEAALPH